MLVAEMKELPKKAGIAELVWYAGEPAIGPCVKENQIFLAKSEGSEFIELRDGSQFIFKTKEDRIYFCGTDGQTAFVVRLKPWIMTHYAERGEEGFYDALKPKEIKVLERQHKTIPVRQGNWWAIRLPYTWNDIKTIYDMLTSWDFQIWKTSERFEFGDFWKPGSYRLNNTRHVLHGMVAEINTGKNCGRSCFIVEGVVEAPGYGPLQLIGPHALFQSEFLMNPQDVD